MLGAFLGPAEPPGLCLHVLLLRILSALSRIHTLVTFCYQGLLVRLLELKKIYQEQLAFFNYFLPSHLLAFVLPDKIPNFHGK